MSSYLLCNKNTFTLQEITENDLKAKLELFSKDPYILYYNKKIVTDLKAHLKTLYDSTVSRICKSILCNLEDYKFVDRWGTFDYFHVLTFLLTGQDKIKIAHIPETMEKKDILSYIDFTIGAGAKIEYIKESEEIDCVTETVVNTYLDLSEWKKIQAKRILTYFQEELENRNLL